jgi:hexosaminidase
MLSLFVLLTAEMQVESMPSIIPAPKSIEFREGFFELDDRITLHIAPEFDQVESLLRSYLVPATGFAFERVDSIASNQIGIAFDPMLADEGYRLVVGDSRIDITAKSAAGAFYAIQSLRQLLPPQIFESERRDMDWKVPLCAIEDSPRFLWRGSHLDVARHFMPKEFVLRYIDLLALHKFNVLHLHLTDDQGWRIEIKKYPKLTEIGAHRKDTMLTYSPKTYEGKPHSGFYTQQDIKDIVAYAKERFVTVVPEIEMPGHSQAAIAAYPELGNTGKQLDVAVDWGVNENVFNVEDSTIQFLQNVLDEVLELFPSQFIHIGGDECPKTQWKQSERAQARMKELGLVNENELQSWFIKQMDSFLAKRGRRLVGWSEILEGGLAPGATLMVWLGDEGAMEAVSSGHDVVMAQTTHTYFDYYQSEDTSKEPHAIGGFLPLSKVYEYNPILPQMSPQQAKHVLGVQFQVWTEYIRTPSQVEYMVFPRACALAEVAWSPIEKRNYEDFIRRLRQHTDRLDALRVNHRRLQ